MPEFHLEPPPKNLDRCAICGIVIGDYKWGRKTMKVTYKYPIAYPHEGRLVPIDMGCYELLERYPEYKPKFDAHLDPMLWGDEKAPDNI